MERSTALKKLEKLLGKKLGYRINHKAPSAEQRAEAREVLPAAIAERKSLTEQRDKRREEILAADPEYQRLRSEVRTCSANVETLSATTRHFKITVGTSEGIFFLVKAEGDSWEEVIAKVATKNGN